MGNYSEGKKCGIGKIFFDDGCVYEGEFKNNFIHGNGLFVWTDGRIYEGEWVNNSMTGKMRLSYEDGRFFQGYYEEDEKNGPGIYSWPDGRMFFGNWTKGVISGEGVEVSADGKKTKGLWIEGNRMKAYKNPNIDDVEKFIEDVLEQVKMDKFEVRLNGKDNCVQETEEEEEGEKIIESESDDSFDGAKEPSIKSFLAFEVIEDDYDFNKSLHGDDFSSKKNYSLEELGFDKLIKKKITRASSNLVKKKTLVKEKGYYSSRSSRGLKAASSLSDVEESVVDEDGTVRLQDIVQKANFGVKKNPGFYSFRESNKVQKSGGEE